MRSNLKQLAACLLIITIALTACSDGEESQITPIATLKVVIGQAIQVPLSELAANPAAYDGAYLQLRGQFRRLPLLYCESDPHPSAATWTIESDSIEALAGGFDAQLRALLPDGLEIEVAGRWQRWEGAVGCGKNTTQQEFWYLEVIEISSPSPLVQTTLTPEGSVADASLSQPTVTAASAGNMGTPLPPDSEGSPTTAPAQSSPTPTGTESLEATALETLTLTPTGTFTLPVAVASNTPTPASDMSPTSPATSVATPTDPSPTPATGISATPTVTPPTNPTRTPLADPGTATPTTAAVALPTATTGPSAFTVVDKGDLDAEELVTGNLASDESHAWGFSVDANDAITVSVAAEPGVDVMISIVDLLENTLWEQNLSPAGSVEAMVNAPLPSAGDYQVRLVSANSSAGSYAMMILFKDSYQFVAQDILDYGSSEAGTLEANNDHFWFFHGASGETITLSLTPFDSGDLFLEVYGPDGDNLTGFFDDTAAGETETLVDFDLPENGMYSIRMGEYDFLPSSYQITLNSS